MSEDLFDIFMEGLPATAGVATSDKPSAERTSFAPSAAPSQPALRTVPSAPPTPVSSSAALGITIIQNTTAEPDTSSSSSPSSLSPNAVHTEKNSLIRLRRPTVSFVQLPVRMAEFPFTTFRHLRTAAASGKTVPCTCIGAVIRKTDPKQSSTRQQRYAVLTLWNLQGISPSADDQLALLLCGSAFEQFYSQLVTGSVVAFSNVARCSSDHRGGGGPARQERPGDDLLLRVAEPDTVRQLGFSVDLGTCGAVSQRSGERCQGLVNRSLSERCSWHVSDLRKVARGTAPTAATSSAVAARRPLSSTSAALSPPVQGGKALATLLKRGADVRRQPSQQLLRQPAFLTVQGGTGLPSEVGQGLQNRGSFESGTYGGVRGGAPLELQPKTHLQPAASYPSAQALGVTTRGRDVLEAMRQQATQTEESRLLNLALRPSNPHSSSSQVDRRESDTKRSREIAEVATKRHRMQESAPTVMTTNERVTELRAQFKPLLSGRPSSYTPLQRFGSHGSVMAHTKNYAQSVVTTTATGQQSALLKAAAIASKGLAESVAAGQISSKTTRTSAEHHLPLTLLGAVADETISVNESLHGEAELQRLASFVERQVAKEKALETLEKITEQHIKAWFCVDCRGWSLQPLNSCLEQRHRVSMKPSMKKYIKCEHCSYKTFVIGEADAKGWKAYPRCPRCHQSSYWVTGDAAPQLAGPVEDAVPL